MKHVYTMAAITLAMAVIFAVPALSADVPAETPPPGYWIAPGQGGMLPERIRIHDSLGNVEVLLAQGPVSLRGNPFFEPLGSNGRACVTCHQPGSGMGLSVAAIRRRWTETQGKDPLFAAVDGSNCPSLPQDQESSHSLLLKRGLFRVSLPWPRSAGPDGSPVEPEFTIEVVRDPTGCNTDPRYGLNSSDPHISVFRRPRVVANLKYLAVDAGAQIYGGAGPFNAKRLGMVMDRDPDTGSFSAMNIMSDAREPSLKTQARDASVDHLQVTRPLAEQQLQSIVNFESQVYAAQGTDLWGDDFSLTGSPTALGARNLQQSPSGVLGDNFGNPAFKSFVAWQGLDSATDEAQANFKASVIRGYDEFMNRPFWIRDVTHINTVGLGNPAKRTCVTCHNLQMVGTDASAGWGDLGTMNEPWANAAISSPTYDSRQPDLPLFKIVCRPEARPHPFLGRVIFTHDPGRALISGKCYDVGSVVMGQLRALAARAPYFASGSAQDLGAVVDFYDRRFNIGLSAQERTDLINFLSVL
jgi:hypothetical protein